MVMPCDGIFASMAALGSFRHDANNTTVGFSFGLERGGLLYFSQRHTSYLQATLDLQATIGRLGNVSGGGELEVQAGDKLSVWVSADKSGVITLGNSNITVTMVEDLTEY
mgnify:CR=1 FL=1